MSDVSFANPRMDNESFSSSPVGSLRARSNPFLIQFPANGAQYKAQRLEQFRRQRPLDRSHSLLNTLQRRPKLVLVAVGLCSLVWALSHVFHLPDLLALWRFKLRDHAYEQNWIKKCDLRKKPMLFVHGSNQVAVVWEMNCLVDVGLSWGAEEIIYTDSWFGRRSSIALVNVTDASVKRNAVPDKTNTHFVYTAHLQGLLSGHKYTYSLALTSEYLVEQPGEQPNPTKHPVLARHTFSWIPDTSKFQLIAIGDNQYNVRIFRRILKAISTFAKPLPSILIHAGDIVQNPSNLAQWQTDFYDTMTTHLPAPIGQTTPLLLARGNHDWDPKGLNIYTGGSPPRSDWLEYNRIRPSRFPHRGTFYAFSIHERCRVIVLDSNLQTKEELEEQEKWVMWEMEREEWTRASIKIVMVHVAPFLEYWEKLAWTSGGESKWGIFVRQRLVPIFQKYNTSLVLSGHQHAYSRGFLPTALVDQYTPVNRSSEISPDALKSVRSKEQKEQPGTIYTIFGGAGGTLDYERVERWGFYEASITGKYHFISLNFEFGVDDLKKQSGAYRVSKDCERGKVLDVLDWKAVDVEGRVFDKFRLEGEACIS